MKTFTLIRSELARLTSSRMGILALLALMIVPVAYGGLYLWGNADPQSNFDRVPAAIVIDDTGATVDDKPVNYGRDAAATLLDEQRFGFAEVTAAEAAAGVRNGTYDFALTFPKDFSSAIASASDEKPRQAKLTLTTDDTNSYLSTTIAEQAAESVRVALVEQVGERASRTLLNGISSIRSGLVDASSGATKLSDGTTTAAAGASSLDSGMASLASGAATLNAGLSELNAKAGALPGSAAQLASGATSVSDGLSSAASGGSSLAGAASQTAALAAGTRAQVAAQLTAAGMSATEQGPILAELDSVASATGQTSAIAGQLSPSLATLSDGASRVSSGAAALSASAPALAGAVSSAVSGATTLSSGAADAAAGASRLDTGLADLTAGSAKLSDSLASGVTDVPKTTTSDRAATAAAIADPVAVTRDAIHAAENYGAGLAPFFISLAAWIGIYALFLIVRPLSARALTAARRPIRTTLAGWATPALLGAAQMLALFAVVTLALGLSPANPLGMLAFMILVSATFAAIVLALNVWLGSVGQFLALLLMIVQLVVAGGTFPWQTLPAPLAALHQALPMSHAVEGVRQLLYGGTSASLTAAIVPLLVWLVAALGVSTLGALRKGSYRTLRELRPSPLAG